MKEQLVLKGPYNFSRGLQRLKIDPLHKIDMEKQVIAVPLWIKDRPVVVEVTQNGSIEQPVFYIKSWGIVDEDKIMDELNRIFHWNIPLQTIYEHFQETDLARLFTTLRGTPFICDFSLYGCLIKTIIHQQLNMKFAYELTKRFVHTFGVEEAGHWFYPTPEKVSKLTVDDLRGLQFSQRKAEYVIDTSKMIVDGKLNVNELAKKENEEIIAELTAIRGVGRWTAECFLMFGLGRTDLFPIQDIGIQNGMKKYYELAEKPSKEEMLLKSERWRPYRTYASLYLWESLEMA